MKGERKARGRPVQNFLDTLLRDTGLCSVKEPESCMLDRKVWHSFGSVDTRCERLSKWMNVKVMLGYIIYVQSNNVKVMFTFTLLDWNKIINNVSLVRNKQQQNDTHI